MDVSKPWRKYLTSSLDSLFFFFSTMRKDTNLLSGPGRNSWPSGGAGRVATLCRMSSASGSFVPYCRVKYPPVTALPVTPSSSWDGERSQTLAPCWRQLQFAQCGCEVGEVLSVATRMAL